MRMESHLMLVNKSDLLDVKDIHHIGENSLQLIPCIVRLACKDHTFKRLRLLLQFYCKDMLQNLFHLVPILNDSIAHWIVQ